MSKMSQEHMKAVAAEEKAIKLQEQREIEEIEKNQAVIKAVGTHAEALKKNPHFKWLMDKIIARGKLIEDAQTAKLLNIQKLTEFGSNAVNNIVSNQIKEAIFAGEYQGLREIRIWVEEAIKNKKRVEKEQAAVEEAKENEE